MSVTKRLDEGKIKNILFRFQKIQQVREKSVILLLEIQKKVSKRKYEKLKDTLQRLSDGY